MPQMWPMFWEILFLVTVFLLLMLMSKFTYLMNNKFMSKSLKKLLINKKSMKW